MKRTILAKIISLAIVFTMMCSIVSVGAIEYPMSDTKYSNGFIEYLVDKSDGRFVIRTEGGSPYRDTDSDKKLLFDKNNDPETSFTSFIIDGEEYIFGNDYGFLNERSGFIESPSNSGGVNTAIWEIDDIEITQILELVEDIDHPNIGNVKIRYEIVNKSNSSKNIGSRILLDTMLGENDGAAVVLGNTGDIISTEQEITGENIPTYWRCSDDLFAPKVMSYGFTKGWGNPAPDKMVVAHWSNISETKWEYSPDENLDFTDENNELGTADSSVALYWNEQSIGAGELKVFETYYGLGDLSNYESNSPYRLELTAPQKLTVNTTKDGYEDEIVQVSVEIDNTLAGSENITNLVAKIVTKEDGFVLADGETEEKVVPSLKIGEISNLSWNLKAVNQDIYMSEPIKVEITSDNNIEPAIDIAYVLMPSINGTPPEIQILSTAPEKVYFEGDKYISIKGNGFYYFNNKNLWNMFMIHDSGKRYKIPKESIEVIGDTKINIAILEGQIEEGMPTGSYSISIEHNDFDNPINIPDDKKVVFTDEIAYKSRSYGVLFVEKRKKNNEYTYNIATVRTKDELDQLKIYVRENEEAPSDYETTAEEAAKGKLVDIIFDIVGDIQMTNEQSTGIDIYRINTNQKNAIINSVIKFKDAKKAIEIKKVDDMILMKGNGTLQLLNYGEIWWFGFDTFIVDGQNYIVDTIVEEEEEDDDEDEDDDDEDKYLEDEDALEVEPNLGEEEEKVNVEISLFDPLSVVTAAASLMIDGFELELSDIILLDEGASLGGKLAVEIPIGSDEEKTSSTDSSSSTGNTNDSGKIDDSDSTKDTSDTSQKSVDDMTEEELDAEIGQTIHYMFMTDEERKEEEYESYKEAVEKENAEQLAAIEKANKEKVVKNSKIRAVLLNDDEIGGGIIELISSKESMLYKVEAAIKLIPKSKEAVTKIIKIVKGKDKEDDDDDSSVGIKIDVKKVIFGKSYGEDFIYSDVKFIGIDGKGEVKIKLPGFNVGGKKKDQGIEAKLEINTIDGFYSLDADVDIKVAEAHAFITIMRYKEKPDSDYKYVLDDLVLSGGYVPGIPIAPPVFINEVGGGVEDLYGVITGEDDAPPMKVVVILGINIVPTFQGDFTLKVSKEGFTLDGAFSIKNLELIKQAHVELHWARPVYYALAAKIEAFEIIEGELSLFIGEVETDDDNDPYEFFMEGRAKVGIKIPKKVKLVGGVTLAGVDLGVSTKKMWGKIKVMKIPLGITWIYDEGVSFGKAGNNQPGYEYVSLTNVELPSSYWQSYDVKDDCEEMTMVIGSNISTLGSSKYVYASIGELEANPYVLASIDRKTHEFKFDDVEIGVIELTFVDEVPNLILKDPSGNIYPLISIDEDEINGNYRVQIIASEDSESGNLENYVYISIENPNDGTWTLESDQGIESTLMDVTVPPGFNSIETQEISDERLKITWDAHHAEESLVSLFIINKEDPESAGYKLEANLDGTKGALGTIVDIPTGLTEGEYLVRATIQHPQYGYESIVSLESITIIDYDKPAKISGLNLETSGNGFMKASWDFLDEEGDITYFASVYDENGDTVNGFTDLEVDENTVSLGGEYIDSNSGDIIKLDTDKEYKVGITAKKTLYFEDGTETIHIGDEVLSSSVTLRNPSPPKISIRFTSDFTRIMEKNFFKTGNIGLEFNADQSDVNTSVYLDGEYFIDFDKSSYDLFFELLDGDHKVEFVSKNRYSDTSSETIAFSIDTCSPELLVDSPLPGYISDTGNVEIKGTAENGSLIKINGVEVTLGANDIFTYEYVLPENKLKESIVIEAVDLSGNSTIYSTEVTNGKIDYFESIFIRPEIDEVLSGSETAFSVYGIDSKGNEIEIDSKNVQWSMVEGGAIADVSAEGVLLAAESGDIVLKASYFISDEYSFDDAMEIKILDNVEFVYMWPYFTSVREGDSVNLSLYESYKYDEAFVDNGIVDWEITYGDSYATLDKYGYFTALKSGTVKVKGSYTDRYGNIQSVENEIRISKESSENLYDINGAISKIWINLVQKEKDLFIENIADITGGFDRKLSVRGIAEIEIPKNTVTGIDQIFIATVNNPDAMIDSDKFVSHSEIIELQLKEAEGMLNRPIKVTFKFRVDNDSDMENIGVYYYNEKFGKWQYLGGKVDMENGTVEVELNHLSKYAVLEKDDGTGFEDISGRWSESYINSIASVGVVNGEEYMGIKYYRPLRQLTRLEFSAIAVRAFEKMYDDIPENKKFDEYSTYSDYKTSQEWGKEYIRKAYEYGLMNGFNEDGNLMFKPMNNITRAEVITVLGRILDMNMADVDYDNDFTDKDSIPLWSLKYVDLLQYSGLLNGYSDGTVRTYNNITREEIAKMCYEWMDYRDIELKK